MKEAVTERVYTMHGRKVYRILTGKPERKRSHWRPWCKCNHQHLVSGYRIENLDYISKKIDIGNKFKSKSCRVCLQVAKFK
jgi:hypothetical protein